MQATAKRYRRSNFWIEYLATQRYGHSVDFIVWPRGRTHMSVRVLVRLAPVARKDSPRIDIEVNWGKSHAVVLEIY